MNVYCECCASCGLCVESFEATQLHQPSLPRASGLREAPGRNSPTYTWLKLPTIATMKKWALIWCAELSNHRRLSLPCTVTVPLLTLLVDTWNWNWKPARLRSVVGMDLDMPRPRKQAFPGGRVGAGQYLLRHSGLIYRFRLAGRSVREVCCWKWWTAQYVTHTNHWTFFQISRVDVP